MKFLLRWPIFIREGRFIMKALHGPGPWRIWVLRPNLFHLRIVWGRNAIQIGRDLCAQILIFFHAQEKKSQPSIWRDDFLYKWDRFTEKWNGQLLQFAKHSQNLAVCFTCSWCHPEISQTLVHGFPKKRLATSTASWPQAEQHWCKWRSSRCSLA